MEKAPIFFKVEDPNILQKNLLESAIETTELLQKFDSLEKTKKQKAVKIKKLATIDRELKSLVKELREQIPEIEKPKQEIKTTPQKTTKKTHTKKLEKKNLREELKEIQRKLKNL